MTVTANVPGIVVGESITEAAERVAAEIASTLGSATVRDRTTGMRRPAQPADIAILFRSRDTHREFEKALERHGVSTYVYKGLGFFDADEVQDAVARVAVPRRPAIESAGRGAFCGRVSCACPTPAWRASRRDLAAALERSGGESTAGAGAALAERTGACWHLTRASMPRWLASGRSPARRRTCSSRCYPRRPMRTSCAASRYRQARENLKKLRAMVRRYQNRGYATLARVAGAHRTAGGRRRVERGHRRASTRSA